jgi:allantoin racemase
MRIVLINPNTSVAMTKTMVDIARAAASDAEIDGLTATFGTPLITNASALAVAADAVVALGDVVSQLKPDGVIVAAFGDPGLSRLRALLSCAVTGIAEAGMAEAAQGGRRFAVVTTTPDLAPSIERAAVAYGHGDLFVGTALTEGDPTQLMSNPGELVAAMESACQRAVGELRAEAIVIGGGPLAPAAHLLRQRFQTPIVEPIKAAVRLAMARARSG